MSRARVQAQRQQRHQLNLAPVRLCKIHFEDCFRPVQPLVGQLMKSCSCWTTHALTAFLIRWWMCWRNDSRHARHETGASANVCHTHSDLECSQVECAEQVDQSAADQTAHQRTRAPVWCSRNNSTRSSMRRAKRQGAVREGVQQIRLQARHRPGRRGGLQGLTLQKQAMRPRLVRAVASEQTLQKHPGATKLMPTARAKLPCTIPT